MPVKTFRPLTPSTRYITIASYDEITKTKPEKKLVYTRKKTGGRNSYGRVTSRGIGRGHKQKIRLVDFKRNKIGVPAKVIAIEYDPRRTARLAAGAQGDDAEGRLLAQAARHQVEVARFEDLQLEQAVGEEDGAQRKERKFGHADLGQG